MFHSRRILSFFLLVLLSGCSVAPSEDAVTPVIKKYYEERKYRVVELTFGRVRSVPLGEKTYMGMPGYYFELKSITLEAIEDTREYQKGERVSFTNASVLLKEKGDRTRGWVIGSITGIPIL